MSIISLLSRLVILDLQSNVLEGWKASSELLPEEQALPPQLAVEQRLAEEPTMTSVKMIAANKVERDILLENKRLRDCETKCDKYFDFLQELTAVTYQEMNGHIRLKITFLTGFGHKLLFTFDFCCLKPLHLIYHPSKGS